MRPFTRLTNAFSKKVDNHLHALSLRFGVYNFVRQHKTLRMSLAMAAGVSDRLWSMEDIAELVAARAPKPGQAWAVQNESRCLMPIKDSTGRAA